MALILLEKFCQNWEKFIEFCAGGTIGFWKRVKNGFLKNGKLNEESYGNAGMLWEVKSPYSIEQRKNLVSFPLTRNFSHICT